MSEEDKIDLASRYAEDHPNFDATFVHSLQEYYNRNGRLTEGQEAALDRIIERFHMEQWDASQ